MRATGAHQVLAGMADRERVQSWPMPERELPGMHLRMEKTRGEKCKGLKRLTVGSSKEMFSVMPFAALHKVHYDLKKGEVAVRSTPQRQTFWCL